MSAKHIRYGDDARFAVFTGMEKIAKTVVTTIGPKGRNVIYSKGF